MLAQLHSRRVCGRDMRAPTGGLVTQGCLYDALTHIYIVETLYSDLIKAYTRVYSKIQVTLVGDIVKIPETNLKEIQTVDKGFYQW